MRRRERDQRDREIVTYRKTHYVYETAYQFDLSEKSIYRIVAQAAKRRTKGGGR